MEEGEKRPVIPVRSYWINGKYVCVAVAETGEPDITVWIFDDIETRLAMLSQEPDLAVLARDRANKL